MSVEEKSKRARAPNITEEEKCVILYCISQEKYIIESKKTDKFSNKEKNEAWERIAKHFNSNKNMHKRDTKCLRLFWEGEKSRSRQGFILERQEHMATRGGPQRPLFVDTTPEVHEMVQPRVDPLIVEIHNIYDSDGTAMGNSENISQDLFPLHNPGNDANLGQISITDGPGTDENFNAFNDCENFTGGNIVTTSEIFHSNGVSKEDCISSNPHPENSPLINGNIYFLLQSRLFNKVDQT